MKILISTFILISSLLNPAQATNGNGMVLDPYTRKMVPIKPLAERWKIIKKGCFERDWTKEKCVIQSPKQSMWQYENDVGDEIREWVQSQVTQTLSYEVYSFFTPTTKAQEKWNALKDEIKKFSDNKNLNECRRACLAKCISANMITYDNDTENAPVVYDPAKIVARGKGVCREYAWLGKDIMNALDVENEFETSVDGFKIFKGHAYLKVKIDHNWYYAEPQKPSCAFYSLE